MKLKKIYDDAKETVISVRIDLLHLDHNHEFFKKDTEKNQLQCNKTHDPEYMEFISSMQESRIPQHCIMDYVSEMHGGPESVPVTAQDMYNLKKAKQRERNANDVAKLLSFFASCKKDNPQFFSDFQLDKEGKILSIFWSHASQQGDYIDFGDAVTFDTTHKTNLYEKPLGMFVGSNHHLHCTIFAFALLGDETVDTFEWVFNAFKTCMGTEGPRVMLTDQDPAMPVALERVFPHTIHRLCLWHVQNSTLDKLYGIRKDWGQKETNTLYMFEIRVARAYTRAVMCRFQESLKYATAFKIMHDEEGGANDWVVQHTTRSNKIVWGQHQFKVTADEDAGKYTCECKHWEHTGLFCVHVLRAFMHLQIDRIPKEYILQRYTTSARQDVPFSRDDRNLKGKDGETKSYRQKMLLKKAMKVVHHASLSKAGNDRALTVMDELLEVLSRLETDIDVEETCGTSGGDGIQDDDEANRDNEKDDEFDERNNKEIQDVSIILEQGVANDQIHIPVRPLEEVNLHDHAIMNVSGVSEQNDNARKKLEFAVDGISLARPITQDPKEEQ
ncbi:protein FAR1-RELATED SEQUENCE 5-like [Zea mays]|uniref:protein FAR1-RELATED SEQUENCE 5-like n=1 Tax=Zea mays TaxID=4577 RepID=UPI0009A96260|nr:protein FAR1-RELATED SEQUENCE 5-like [Zea mays]|eukprot:XP_020399544.1 protein FAR1-RELATED SEQUENCE 5-like [Zea mays]